MPSTIVSLLSELTEHQKNAVKEIGFGSLLHFSVTEIPYDMIIWLCSRYICHARMFRIDNGKEFQITCADVHDVFGIPLGRSKLPLLGVLQEKDLKNSFKERYGSRGDVTVVTLVNLIKNDEGQKLGDEMITSGGAFSCCA